MKEKKKSLRGMTVKQLKDELAGLHSAINVVECFGTKDLLLYDLIANELERRGIEVMEGRTLTFQKRAEG